MRSTNLERDHAEHTAHMGRGVPPETTVAHMGPGRHAGHSVAMFRDKFWLTLIRVFPWEARISFPD